MVNACRFWEGTVMKYFHVPSTMRGTSLLQGLRITPAEYGNAN
jgi:hypothetical protein